MSTNKDYRLLAQRVISTVLKMTSGSAKGPQNSNLSFFERLPVEVRVSIYERLAYSDLLSLRQINRKIKEEMEEHMDFHLKFDQTNTVKLKKLLSLRLRSCHVVHFTSRKIIRVPKVFAHPSRIKKLTFDGLICSSNLLRILNHCTAVEHLIFTHQTLGIDELIEPDKFAACLRKLGSVQTLDLQLLRYPQGDPFETEENIEAFLRATFPELKSFRLYFSLWGNFSSLLPFLERHRKTLKEVELHLGDRGDSQTTEMYLRTSPMQVADKIRLNLLSLDLKKFYFRDDVLNLNNAEKDLILSILQEQRKLQVLQFHSPGELSWPILTNIVTINESTLTEVVVYNIQSTPAVGPRRLDDVQADVVVPELTMDMTMFSRCPKLKTLALSCSSSNGNDPNVVGTVILRMSNLHLIPASVERLHLAGFTLDGEELVNLAMRTGNHLKEVLIADAGTMRYSDVLNSFLKHCHELKCLNVRPVLLQAANEQLWWKEVSVLSKLYERFMGIQYDPIDDLEGFEANITDTDKEWLKTFTTS